MENSEKNLQSRADELEQAAAKVMDKRAMETAILSMVYKIEEFYSVVPSERPDFELIEHERTESFGVEITQLFPSESMARLNLIPGYRERLWSGGTHMSKRDVRVLEAVKIEIKDKDGNLRAKDVPVVMTKMPTKADFRKKLSNAIKEKSEKGYDVTEYTHINLIILDWFHLQFDVSNYTTHHFFDEEIRQILKESPFREVFLILNNSTQLDSKNEHAIPDARIFPLQHLLAMERLFATGKAISEIDEPEIEFTSEIGTIDDLNLLAIDHVSRVQGYGDQVVYEDKKHLRYRGSLLTIGEKGLSVLHFGDHPFEQCLPITTEMRLPLELEKKVDEKVRDSGFGYPFAAKANRPIVWR